MCLSYHRAPVRIRASVWETRGKAGLPVGPSLLEVRALIIGVVVPHSADSTAAVCGCAKPVCLPACVALCLLALWLCASWRWLLSCLTVSEHIQKVDSLCATCAHTHSPTHSPTYQRLRSTICTRDTVSYDCRGHSLSYAYLLSSTVALSGPHQYYMLLLLCVSVCACMCVAGMKGIFLAHTHGRAVM